MEAVIGVNSSFDELFVKNELELLLQKVKNHTEKRLSNITPTGQETDDIVQEVMIQVYKSLHKFDSGKSKLSTFIDRVTANQIRDCLRLMGGQKNLAVVNAESIDEYMEYGERPIEFEEIEIVTDMMNHMGLNEREKQIFQLRSSGYEFNEIAKSLGVSNMRVYQLWNGIKEKYKAL